MAVKENGTMVTKRNRPGESIEVGSQGRDVTLINKLNKLAEENRTSLRSIQKSVTLTY